MKNISYKSMAEVRSKLRGLGWLSLIISMVTFGVLKLIGGQLPLPQICTLLILAIGLYGSSFLIPKRRIFVLMGPSGCGKTTLGLEFRKWGIPELISHTTRKPRVGEVEGETYKFISKEEFDKLEKVEETCYAGNYYCLSTVEVNSKLSNNKSVHCITDRHGMSMVKEMYGNKIVKVLFIGSAVEELAKRMRARGDSEENVQKRLANLIENKELDNGKYADYIVNNNDPVIEFAIRQIKEILKETA